MNCQSQERKCFHNMVESLDVVLLVENDILLFLISEIAGQIDFRTEQADHKGRLDIICDEDIISK